MDLMIGIRLHALIFAGVMGTPMIGISYDPKIDRFLKSMYNYECYKCKGEKITVGELCLKYRNGTYLITMQGHITCMIDGVIYDTWDPRDKYAWAIWKIYR